MAEEKNARKIYRYFNSEKDRESFLAGNIWFCGANKNRFFQDKDNDIYEYRNDNVSCLFEYALSCSTEIIKPEMFNIEINNVSEFIKALATSVANGSGHTVSWLDVNKLKEYQHIIPALASLKEIPQKNVFDLHVVGINGQEVTYVDKKDCSAGNSPEPVKNAWGKNRKFKDEKEYRIHLNTSGFSDHQALYNAVEYLKVSSPEAAEFCKQV